MASFRYRVSEVAALLGVNPSTLRYYQSRGLIDPDFTDPWTGYREFTPQQLYRLNFLRDMALVELPLEEVRILVSEGAPSRAPEIFKRHREALEDRIRELQHMVSRLKRGEEAFAEAPDEEGKNPRTENSLRMEVRDSGGYSFEGYARGRTRLIEALRKGKIPYRDEMIARFRLHPGKPFWSEFLSYSMVIDQQGRVNLALGPGCQIVRCPPQASLEKTVEGPIPKVIESAEGLWKQQQANGQNWNYLELVHVRGTNLTPWPEQFLTKVVLLDEN